MTHCWEDDLCTENQSRHPRSRRIIDHLRGVSEGKAAGETFRLTGQQMIGGASLLTVGRHSLVSHTWWVSVSIHVKGETPMGSPSITCKKIISTIALGFWWPRVIAARNAGDIGSISGSGRSPGEGMATHSSIFAWEIPWTEEYGGLQSMRSQRVGNNLATEHTPTIALEQSLAN